MSPIEKLYRHYLENPFVSTDSRKISPGCIFFAIKGETFNGNRFAAAALEKGASLAVVDEEVQADASRCLKVEDSLRALQQLAAVHRENIQAEILAITGSNGKTTTKELVGRVLSAVYPAFATSGNLNNHIGVPVTLLSIPPGTTHAVIEMGANHQGEIAALCKIANPGSGLITNIGKAHLEGFGGPQGVIKAKTELYAHLRSNHGMAFVNVDNPLLMSKAEGIPSFTYGSAKGADCRVRLIDQNPYLLIEWKQDGRIERIQTRMYGAYNFENIAAAIAVGEFFHVDKQNIIDSIAGYVPENNRSQILATARKNTIILDAYNANPTSMTMALEDFSALPGKNKVLILGDMLEMGEYSRSEHQAVITRIIELGFHHVFLVGEIFDSLEVPQPWRKFPDTALVKQWLKKNEISEHSLLIKGSRKIGLEDLIESL